MKVSLSVEALGPYASGIGRYTWQLWKGLAGRQDVQVQYHIQDRVIADPGSLLTGDAHVRDKQPFQKIRRWRDRRNLANSLIHGPNYFLPAFAAHGVITVHDLSVFRYPETHPIERVRQFEREFASSLSKAVKIITDTEAVRRELISYFGLPENRVTAIHLGVDDHFRPQKEEAVIETLTRLGLRYKGYGLCVSTIEPRKKIAELLEAWRRLPFGLRNQYPIVLAGGSGWLYEELRNEISRDNSEGWLIYLGYVEEVDLPALYAGAALFAYPSMYEGFGLPPLEAMACGAPVVVSPYSCMPEVCGNAAVFADPQDPEQLSTRIAEVLSDKALHNEMSRLGIERAKQFTWSNCLNETVEVYNEAKSLIS